MSYQDDGLPWITQSQRAPTRNRDSTFKNQNYPMWCLLKMRHAVFTTCCLCCTDGTQTSMPTVYFNKARLSLTVLTISASAKSPRLFIHQLFLKILNQMNGCCLSSVTLYFRCEPSCGPLLLHSLNQCFRSRFIICFNMPSSPSRWHFLLLRIPAAKASVAW